MENLTEYNCPRCGKPMHVKENCYLLTDPPSIMYECDDCGWVGSPWVSEKSVKEE